MKTSFTSMKALVIAFVLLVMVVIPSVPQFAYAQATVTDPGHTAVTGVNTAQQSVNTAFSGKDFAIKLLEQVGQSIAKVLLNKLTESTVNWINGGFKGSPQFVQNPQSFFKGIGDTQLKNIIDVVGYDVGMFPYGRQVAKNLIYNYIYTNGSFADKAKYTLDQTIGADAKKFQSDFHVGGWAAYDAYTQNPANNPFGMLMISSDEASQVIAKGQATAQAEMAQGQGFLSQKVCEVYRDNSRVDHSAGQQGPETPAQLAAEQQQASQQAAAVYQGPYATGQQPAAAPTGTQAALTAEHNFLGAPSGNDEDCLQWKTLSPGSVVQSEITRALGSKFSQNELGQALGNSISSIVNALANSLISKGLSALSSISSGSGSTKDTWSYNGLTLSGQNTTDSSNDPDNWAFTPDKIIDFKAALITGDAISTYNSQYLPLSATLRAKYVAAGYTFKESVANGITITTVYDPSTTTLARTQAQADTYKQAADIVNDVPNRLKALDACIPGPDYHWDTRFDNRFSKILNKFKDAASGKDDDSNAVKKYNGLDSFLTTLKQQITLRAITNNIPDALKFQQTVKDGITAVIKNQDLEDLYTQNATLYAQLKQIRDSYQNLVTRYGEDSIPDADLGPLLQQYARLSPDVATGPSLADAQKRLVAINTAGQISTQSLVQCQQERRDNNTPVNFAGEVYNPFGSAPVPEEGITTPPRMPGYGDIVLLVDIRATQEATLENLIGTSSTEATDLITQLKALDDTHFTVAYSLIKGNDQHKYFTDASDTPLTNMGLYHASVDFASELDVGGGGDITDQLASNPLYGPLAGLIGDVTSELDQETNYYCNSIYRHTSGTIKIEPLGIIPTPIWFFLQFSKNIKCNSFYHSTIRDYRVSTDF